MFAKINGIRMRYDLQGPKTSPALVLVHGFPFSSELWKQQVEALSAGFRVLTYDLRGMGGSALGRAPQPLEAYADDLLALMDHLGLKRAALVGLSMGGYIVLRAAERNPERFWALALCDTKASADSDAAKLGRAAGIKSIRHKGVGAFVKSMLPKLLARRGLAAIGLLKIMKKNSADGMANALAAMAGRSDTSSGLRRYRGPVLVLAGSRDALIAASESRAMAKLARHGRFVSLPGAGHVSNLEAPAFFNRSLTGFLRKSALKGR
jgi:pimeloyl-ACP methyl ester carboxylesterase